MCIIIIAHRCVFNQQRWKNYFRRKWLHCTKLTSYRKPTQSKSILKDPMVCLSVDGEKEMAGWVALCSILVWWELLMNRGQSHRPTRRFLLGFCFLSGNGIRLHLQVACTRWDLFFFHLGRVKSSMYMYLFYHRHYALRLQFNERGDILKNIFDD